MKRVSDCAHQLYQAHQPNDQVDIYIFLKELLISPIDRNIMAVVSPETP